MITSRFLFLTVFLIPAAVCSAQINLTVNATQNVKAISQYIYGTNDIGAVPMATFDRSGGNRMTAYNWETNDSNAGSDWFFQNDSFLSNSTTPGQTVLGNIQSAASNNRGMLLTIPTAGYVSADRNGDGDVRYTGNTWNGSAWVQGTANPNYLAQRFKVSLPSKGSAFTLTPNTSDGNVYQDEFVNWVNNKKTANQQVFYSLDNEPDLWQFTHAEIHPTAPTYAEMVQRSTDYAKAIKAVSPNALVFGAVNYGWNGFANLQGATPDASIPNSEILNFQASYLKQMKIAATNNGGQRLLDVLDMHWYPEAYNVSGTTRITSSSTAADVVAARLQAPRSLWDASYGFSNTNVSQGENSWIARWSTQGAIKLLPRQQALVNAYYPGTKLAFTEYQYGAGNHWSGGLAEADALGAFGAQGLYAANWWSDGTNAAFVRAAMRMYLNYDGTGKHFGDTSVFAGTANTTDNATISFYASTDSTNPNRMVLVLVNKSSSAQNISISLSGMTPLMLAHLFQFNANSAVVGTGNNATVTISQLADILLTNPNLLSITNLAPNSVTTIELVPEPATIGLIGMMGLLAMRRRR